MRTRRWLWLALTGLLLLVARAPGTGELAGGEELSSGWQWDLPARYPRPVIPADNPMSTAKVELGRHLFYDVRLSGNQTQSCASCAD